MWRLRRRVEYLLMADQCSDFTNRVGEAVITSDTHMHTLTEGNLLCGLDPGGSRSVGGDSKQLVAEDAVTS